MVDVTRADLTWMNATGSPPRRRTRRQFPEARDGQSPDDQQPEGGLRPFAVAKNSEDRGRKRKEADEYDGMSRSDMLKRQRREKWKADDYADRHDDERATSAIEGRFSRSATRSAAPSRAAITARADVRNTGVNPPTATRVAGREPLNIITPRSPLPHPSVVRCKCAPFQLPHSPRRQRAGQGIARSTGLEGSRV